MNCSPCAPRRRRWTAALAATLATLASRRRRAGAVGGGARRAGSGLADRLRPRLLGLRRAVRDPGAALGEQRLPERGHGDRPHLRRTVGDLPLARPVLRRRARPDRRRPALRHRPLAGHVRDVRLPEQLTGAGGAGRQVHRHRRAGRPDVPRRRRVHGAVGPRQPGPGARSGQRPAPRPGPHPIGRIGRVVRRAVPLPARCGSADDPDRPRARPHRDLRPGLELPGQHRHRRQHAGRLGAPRAGRHAPRQSAAPHRGDRRRRQLRAPGDPPAQALRAAAHPARARTGPATSTSTSSRSDAATTCCGSTWRPSTRRSRRRSPAARTPR